MVYQLHDIVQLKKDHPCKKSSFWEITRMGVDIKLKCLGCGSSAVSYTHLTLPTTPYV